MKLYMESFEEGEEFNIKKEDIVKIFEKSRIVHTEADPTGGMKQVLCVWYLKK